MGIEIDHVHIFTDKVDETVEFYTRVFEATEIRRIQTDTGDLVHLAVGKARIVVSRSLDVGIPHFAISVDNLLEFTRNLEIQGISIESTGAVAGFKNAFIKDNNGILVEIITPATT